MLCLNTVVEVFLPQLLADGFVYCGLFWPTFVMMMLWLMLLPYMNVVADVYAIVDSIGSHLVVLK